MPLAQLNRFKRRLVGRGPLCFPEGFYGFEGWHQFVLVNRQEESPFLWLEAETTKQISFVVVDPFLICPHYSPKIRRSDLASLGVTDSNVELLLLSIVNTKENPYTLNLGFPILIHWQKRRGKQIWVNNDLTFPMNNYY